MTDILIQPVIMSGGSGTRLWPMSRKAMPKQFLPLIGAESLFQETLRRLQGPRFAPPLVIAGEAHRGHIEDQAKVTGLALAGVVVEPDARNTAAVAAAAARWTKAHNPDALILLAPSDQQISDPEGFRERALTAAVPAQKGRIVTFGIQPNEPHTGFGYIERAEEIDPDAYAVAAFHEKPALEKAREYLAHGGFFWNAGIFLFGADAMERELRAHAPGVYEAVDASFDKAKTDGIVLRLDAAAFAQSPSTSIDYAVMEKTNQAAVIAPVMVGWSDIGSWTALSTPADDPRLIEIDGSGNILYSDGPAVGAVGVENLVIVATKDGVLVAHKDRAQDVKSVIETLKSRQMTDRL